MRTSRSISCALIDALVDAGSLLEIHARWAREVLVGYARLDGRVIGIVANQPKVKGGVLFVDSADKCARFIWTCNAFNIPLLFLADVPGFMIGTQVEKEGIIRHGAKMISAVSEANVPKISVIVRKAYGAGLYAMAGPAFDPDCCLALPTASIAVMGPQAAINAVYYNQLQAISDDADERAARTAELRSEYARDIDILHLASELVIDAVIQPEDLRGELIRRFAARRRQAAASGRPSAIRSRRCSDRIGAPAPGVARKASIASMSISPKCVTWLERGSVELVRPCRMAGGSVAICPAPDRHRRAAGAGGRASGRAPRRGRRSARALKVRVGGGDVGGQLVHLPRVAQRQSAGRRSATSAARRSEAATPEHDRVRRSSSSRLRVLQVAS